MRRFRLKSFGQLLLALILVTLAQPMLAQYRLLNILTLLVLLDGIYIATPGEAGAHFRRAINTLWGVAAVFVIAALIFPKGILRESAEVVSGVFQTTLFAICLATTLLYVLREKRVTLDLIYAAMAGYFFIVMTFAGIFKIASILDPSALAFQPWVTDPSRIDARSQITYFSFVTAASLGYGDIVPRNAYVQMFAAIEVVIGQFYLATIVARLVSLYGSVPPEGSPK